MHIPFEFSVAVRYLFKKKERFISISALLAVIGITIGTSALILATSLTNGFDGAIRSKILGIETSAQITQKNGGLMMENKAIIKKIRATKGVKAAFPSLRSEAILSSSSRFGTVIFQGVKNNFIAARLKKYIQKGSFSNDAILIGKPLLKSLKLHIGDPVKLIIPFGDISPFGLIPKTVNLKISGIFQTGFYQYDHAFIFMPLLTAQKSLGTLNMISGIDIATYNPYDAPIVAKRLSRQFQQFHISTWISQNANLFYAMRLQKVIIFIVLFLILIVSSFAISASLIMLVNEKKADIAILRSMGAKKAQIRSIFIIEGLTVASAGIITGVITGTLLSFLMGHYQFIKLPKDIFYLNTIPVSVSPFDVALTALAALIISFFSTLYPASKAAAEDITKQIRQ